MKADAVGFRECGKRPPEVIVETRADGTVVMRHPAPLGQAPTTILSYLDRWATETPDAIAFAERAETDWAVRRYGELHARVNSIAQAMLDLGVGHGDRVMILSPASIAHAEITLAAMRIGASAVPVSPHYSRPGRGFDRLHKIFDLVQPAIVFAENPAECSDALASLDLNGTIVVHAGEPVEGVATGHLLDDLAKTQASADVGRAHAAIQPDDIAKILFTSGTTGTPKGVINTHGMLASNQAMLDGVETHAGERGSPDEGAPLLISWQPWHHTMAGNANFNRTLRTGGAYYIDDGGPVGEGIKRTIRNISSVSPTSHADVAIGWAALIEAMESDAKLRASFFARLTSMGFAAASLPDGLWRRLNALAIAETGTLIQVAAAYGSTETGPALVNLWWPDDRPGELGLPLPGAVLKLVPLPDGRYEVRAKSPSITPGYFRNAEQTADMFDEEGFLKLRDAVQLDKLDGPIPEMRFAGRTNEDFKLQSGTWVVSGPLRAELANRLPMVRDVVLTGIDRESLGLLLWPAPGDPMDEGARIDAIRAALIAHNRANGASSTRIERFRVMDQPLAMSAGEISDKGSVNQIAVQQTRAAAIDELYSDPVTPPNYLVRT